MFMPKGGRNMKVWKIFVATMLFATLLSVTVSTVWAEDGFSIGDFFSRLFAAVPTGFVVGFVTSMLGYLRTTPPENFNLSKFLATLILSVFIGTLTGYLGWDYTTAVEWLANAGVTVWIYWFVSIVVQRVSSRKVAAS